MTLLRPRKVAIKTNDLRGRGSKQKIIPNKYNKK